MAVRMLWKFVVGRAKTIVKNYNVLERAEKVMEQNKKSSAPRHPGTEAKFKVLIKERPRIPEDVDKKHVELLDRLKTVKVSSKDGIQDEGEEGSNRPLPQMRQAFRMPEYGYEEPRLISEGKSTLRQALEWISNHQNDPSTHSVASIAHTHKLKASDVENTVEYFRAFQIYVSQDQKIGFTKEKLKALGINKVFQPMYNVKFKDMEKGAVEIEDKK